VVVYHQYYLPLEALAVVVVDDDGDDDADDNNVTDLLALSSPARY
jgi:hypothetical protein